MLPKKARLTTQDISFVLRKPTAKLFSPHITLVLHIKETTLSPLRVNRDPARQDVVSFGIGMSKKLFTSSVDMHRKRRVLYARIQEALPSLSVLPSHGLLVVVIPKQSYFDLTVKEQIEVFSELFGRVRVE